MKLVAVDAVTDGLLLEIGIGPVFCGPALSCDRVYVGSGNTVFTGGAGDRQKRTGEKPEVTLEQQTGGLFPLQNIGSVRCFGLP